MKRLLAICLSALLALGCALSACAEDAKGVILVVSFGTSYNDSRERTIGAIEQEIAAAYPDYEIRRAFTAQIIIDKLKTRDGLAIDNVTEAMERLVADGVKNVIVQPTHIMNGFEYDDVVKEVSPYADKFDTFAIGKPLLTSHEDYEQVIDAFMKDEAEAGSSETALVYMGHGTEHFANATYSQMQLMLEFAGYENVFLGTVEGFPTLDNVMAELKAGGYTKVVLTPFMIVAGDHANNDMAGDEADSWKTVLAHAGYEVECRIQGLGENPAVRKLLVKHVQAAIDEGAK